MDKRMQTSDQKALFKTNKHRGASVPVCQSRSNCDWIQFDPVHNWVYFCVSSFIWIESQSSQSTSSRWIEYGSVQESSYSIYIYISSYKKEFYEFYIDSVHMYNLFSCSLHSQYLWKSLASASHFLLLLIAHLKKRSRVSLLCLYKLHRSMFVKRWGQSCAPPMSIPKQTY